MENGWNLFNTNSATTTTITISCRQGQYGNFALDMGIREHQYHWSNGDNNTHNSFHHHHLAPAAATATKSTTYPEASADHALLFSHQRTSSSNNGHQRCSSASSSHLYAGIGSQYYHPDPHPMCLKLGKRHYSEDATCPSMRHVAGFSISKRDKPYYGGDGGMVGPSILEELTVAIAATMPRCQVEGCHVALLNAKDYHRREKVCELHSKAAKVVVHGLDQRFCQQCSRFHAVTSFDDSKRSCRRRLAGHNMRRRKTSRHHDISISRNNPSQGQFPYLSSLSGRALALLSSRNKSLISSPDLSSRCRAALRELIAENRAALLARQLIVDKNWPFHHHQDINSNPLGSNQHLMFSEYSNGWDRYDEAAGNNNVTLDLMQAPTSAFELLSMRGKSKEEDECCQFWSSFNGTHVVN